MELITAVFIGTLLGYLAPTPRAALVRYLIAWAIVFPIQTAAVSSDSNGDDIGASYFLVNAAILAFGIALNQGAHRLAGRRRRNGAVEAV